MYVGYSWPHYSWATFFNPVSLFSIQRYVCVLRRSSKARRSWLPMLHLRSSKKPSVRFVPGLMFTFYWCNCQRTVSVWILMTSGCSWRQSKVCLCQQLMAVWSFWSAGSPQLRAEKRGCLVLMDSPATYSLQNASCLTLSTSKFVRTWTCL